MKAEQLEDGTVRLTRGHLWWKKVAYVCDDRGEHTCPSSTWTSYYRWHHGTYRFCNTDIDCGKSCLIKRRIMEPAERAADKRFHEIAEQKRLAEAERRASLWQPIRQLPPARVVQKEKA